MSETPRKLSVIPGSMNYDPKVAKLVAKVYVDGVHIPECVAYDIEMGWAKGQVSGIWQPKVYGVVTVKMKP